MFKFLDPTGCTYYNGKAFQYNLPQRGQKVAGWTEHPSPAKPDGRSCGPGGLHVMLRLNAIYAPTNWHPWWVQGVRGELGRDSQKLRAVAVQLRRILPNTFYRALRPPFSWGCQADLREANLHGADLHGADLREADLRGADLHGANLCGADLHGADLHGANLREADLRWANLRGADLHRADLHGADLHGADLHGADLREAMFNEATKWPDSLSPREEGATCVR